MNLYDSVLRPAMFSLDAETAHETAIWSLGLLDLAPGVARRLRTLSRADDRTALRMRVTGLDFPNPIGIGAGLDKDGVAVVGLFATGFGALELGTVTPRAQPGNDKPRAFRMPEHQALINRMGFNNQGVQAMASRLRELEWHPGPVGVNIGKNKDTPLENAIEDYVTCATVLDPLCDYLAINLSSPNTPNLRALQEPAVLEKLLLAVRGVVKKCPVFLKIAPDLSDEAVDAVVDVVRSCRIDGMICTNTTLARPFEHKNAKEAGGLSGKPLATRSTEVVRRAYRRADGTLPIIGVGGIFTAADAWEKICAGSSLIQLYTGFIYGGPASVKLMLDGLEAELQKAGLSSLSAAVGRNA